ncbi:MAG: hypothetical protein NFW04_09155, partial [Candidatus Accumulibacter sp.]|uniref:hypothetical protein n=1 Tax=Accumulibacter sp. TaxID=2053492 RepID=UPI0025D18FB0
TSTASAGRRQERRGVNGYIEPVPLLHAHLVRVRLHAHRHARCLPTAKSGYAGCNDNILHQRLSLDFDSAGLAAFIGKERRGKSVQHFPTVKKNRRKTPLA